MLQQVVIHFDPNTVQQGQNDTALTDLGILQDAGHDVDHVSNTLDDSTVTVYPDGSVDYDNGN